MTRYGYFLATEDWPPDELLRQARLAEETGFEALWISDHFHPWTDEQGQAPFVWTVLGALARETSLPITTAVTCPTLRIHPAIVAQAAATTAVMAPGRFTLGVGTGEALNEQVTGAPWPLADQRLDMLEEAIEIMRALWTGEVVTHRGPYYDVEHARLYTVPDEPPKVYLSGFGPDAADLAGRIADGFISTSPDAEMARRFEAAGGAGKPKQAGAKVCFAPSADDGLDIVLRHWPNQGLPGELPQVLRTPEHIMQASTLVTRETLAGSVACGPDADEHRKFLTSYVDAGFDEVYVNQIGPDQDGFFGFYRDEVLPALRST
ncbi:TIGR03557 family F420-dependent LLM class oxidoreductase [Jiangella aurantiaca]|uniref:TIGR03557 family F420-dependent LLM class oxidoreductase n=1 Tax=Jiangella aurantiaca TaxID=2530373 RepID=A0A4R5ALN8_9ACTN|nr:TIGR03557 family F420-dependent LLM class oxidoreductase [Jiangella aurantiaca]TDD71062.1 TIGR03557 family F420-dependent LLM class oxidoreductase [Jiangella aurantiaca]